LPAPCAKVSTSGIKSSASVHESTHSGPSWSDPCVNPSSEICRPAIILLAIVVLLCFDVGKEGEAISSGPLDRHTSSSQYERNMDEVETVGHEWKTAASVAGTAGDETAFGELTRR